MLAQRCPGLQVLNVGGCSRVTDVGVAALAAGCTVLRQLDLSYNKRLSDAAVASLEGVVRFPVARWTSCHLSLAAHGGRALDTGLEQLEFLGLNYCSGVALPAVARLVAGCSSLRRLSICDMVPLEGIPFLTNAVCYTMAGRSSPLQALRLTESRMAWRCECAPVEGCRADSLLRSQKHCQIQVRPFDELCDELDQEDQESM